MDTTSSSNSDHSPTTSSLIIKKANMIMFNSKKFQDLYHLSKKELGSGAFGVVLRCVHRQTKQERACKVIAKNKIKNITHFKDEIAILQKLDHPHILKLYEYFEDAKNFYLVTEMCRGGEVFDKIIEKEHFSEVEAAKLFRQMLRGINYCHSHNIAHRDLKPENFLYETSEEDSDIKIIDFGLSKIFTPGKGGKITKMKTKAGTPYYISPEVIAGNYDQSCDMWSVGCILYTLLVGYPPFCGDDDQEILGLVVKAKYDFDGPEWKTISAEAKDLIKKLIVRPERRLSATEALEHKWMKKNCKDTKLSSKNLERFSRVGRLPKLNKMQQAALTAIAIQSSPDDVRNLKEIFMSLDTNGDGSLSFREIEDGLRRLALPNKEQILAHLRDADTDLSGSIDYTEFLAATMDPEQYLRPEYLQAAFDMFDTDGSGSIDVKEATKFFTGGDREAVQEVIREIDINGDGEIDFAEFSLMMSKLTV